jgi:hypothetical protein
MNQSTGLVAHRVEVVAEGTGGRQLEPQMFEPESERDRLFQQQPGVLVFAAAVETAQHQKKIDDIGIGAGPACLQFLAYRSRSSSMRSTIEGSKRAVLQLCSHPVVGWPDASPGLFGLRLI